MAGSQQHIVLVSQPTTGTRDTATPYVGALGTVTPGAVAVPIPKGSTSVTLLNRGTVSAEYGVDVTPATALSAGASVVVSLSNKHNLNLQGANLNVECIFTVPNP